jgi:hypothetical protein
MLRDARIIGNHRYWLTRTWNVHLPRVTFVGFNPSTADASQDDATIRKCIGFAKRWGHGSLLMLNVFTYRSTDPLELLKRDWIIGDPEEELAGYNLINMNELVICGWGTAISKMPFYVSRPKMIIERLVKRAAKVRALHINKDGSPKHPLYVSYGTKLLHYQGVDL